MPRGTLLQRLYAHTRIISYIIYTTRQPVDANERVFRNKFVARDCNNNSISREGEREKDIVARIFKRIYFCYDSKKNKVIYVPFRRRRSPAITDPNTYVII